MCMYLRVLASRWSVLLMLVMVAPVVGWPVLSKLHAAELPTIAQVKQRVAEQHQLLNAVYLEIQVKGEVTEDPKGWGETLRLIGRGSIPNEIEYFGFKDKKRLLHKVYAGDVVSYSGVRPEVDKNAPPERQEWQREQQARFDTIYKDAGRVPKSKPDEISKGFSSRKLAFDGQEVRQLAGDLGLVGRPGTQGGEGPFTSKYLQVVGFHIDDPTAPAAENEQLRDGSVVGLLELPDIESSAEVIDGVECLRVTAVRAVTPPANHPTAHLEESSFRRTVWFDLAHGLMVCKIEVSESTTGQVKFRSVNQDPKEILPGFWLPMACRLDTYGPRYGPESLRQKPALVTRMKVLKCTVNDDVDDSLFAFNFKPGTEVHDYVRGARAGAFLRYYMPRDPADLDRVIDEALHGMKPRIGSLVLIWTNVIAVVIVMIVIARRYSSKYQKSV